MIAYKYYKSQDNSLMPKVLTFALPALDIMFFLLFVMFSDYITLRITS